MPFLRVTFFCIFGLLSHYAYSESAITPEQMEPTKAWLLDVLRGRSDMYMKVQNDRLLDHEFNKISGSWIEWRKNEMRKGVSEIRESRQDYDCMISINSAFVEASSIWLRMIGWGEYKEPFPIKRRENTIQQISRACNGNKSKSAAGNSVLATEYLHAINDILFNAPNLIAEVEKNERVAVEQARYVKLERERAARAEVQRKNKQAEIARLEKAKLEQERLHKLFLERQDKIEQERLLQEEEKRIAKTQLEKDRLDKLVAARKLVRLTEESNYTQIEREISDEYEKGMVFYDKYQYEEALQIFQPMVENGHPGAQFMLGFLHQNGYGLTKNYNLAIKFYTKAADQGNANAQARLGLMYLKGDGVSKNYDIALTQFKKSAVKNTRIAQTGLGFMYLDGLGVEQDYEKAVDWFSKAAVQGEVNAQLVLTNMGVLGQGGEKNIKESLILFTKSAVQGNVLAQVTLGDMYKDGILIPRDYTESVNWYDKAANNGNAVAQFNLAALYHSGRGVTQSYSKSITWYKRAAEQGHTEAQHALGLMHYSGKGVTKNHKLASDWFLKAANSGNLKAQYDLGSMYHEADGLRQNYANSLKWFSMAAEQGLPSAQFKVATIYEDGLGLPKDLDNAITWYKRSSDQGYEKSRLALVRIATQQDNITKSAEMKKTLGTESVKSRVERREEIAKLQAKRRSEISELQAKRTVEKESSWNWDWLIWSLLVGLFIVGIGLLVGGHANSIVIYYDMMDLMISVWALLLPVSAILFMAETDNWIVTWIISPVLGIAGLYLLAINYMKAITHTRNIWLGILVGTFKLVFIVFAFAAVMGPIDKAMKKGRTLTDIGSAAIIMIVFYALFKAIINGPEVYRANGWKLSDLRQGG